MLEYLCDALSWSGDEDDFLRQVQFAWRGFTAAQQRHQGHWYPELTLFKGAQRRSLHSAGPYYLFCVYTCMSTHARARFVKHRTNT